jgi:hypothetical protein
LRCGETDENSFRLNSKFGTGSLYVVNTINMANTYNELGMMYY